MSLSKDPATSASGPKRTSVVAPHMSAFGGKADMAIALRKPARLGGLSPIVWERDDMKVILRRASEADAKHTASLLTELGYPSTEADARDRLVRSLRSATSYCLVAELAAEVVGLVSAELVFYFPTGSTICRITSLVVSSQHRGHGLGQKLLTAAIDFAREHHCSGLELTSAEGRVDAHRFYRRLGFSRMSFRFFQTV